MKTGRGDYFQRSPHLGSGIRPTPRAQDARFSRFAGDLGLVDIGARVLAGAVPSLGANDLTAIDVLVLRVRQAICAGKSGSDTNRKVETMSYRFRTAMTVAAAALMGVLTAGAQENYPPRRSADRPGSRRSGRPISCRGSSASGSARRSASR